MRADLGWWCPQLPFSLPTANEALLVPPKPYFGNVSEAYVREGRHKLDSCSRRKAGSERTPVLDDPEPYLPDDFFERLSVAQQPYEGLIPSRRDISMQENKRRRSNVLGVSGRHYGRPGDHWLNWRERLAHELEGLPESNITGSSVAACENFDPL